MFERRLMAHFDWSMLAAILLLSGIGLAMIHSATYDGAGQYASQKFYTQLYAVVLGIFVLAVFSMIDYRIFTNHAILIYVLLLAVLVYVLVAGIMHGGARRWISFGFINFQPSEFARLFLAVVIAALFNESRNGARTLGSLLMGVAVLVAPVVLIAKEPDLGTAMTLLPVFLGIAFVAGLRFRYIGAIVLLSLFVTPFIWTYALQDYQRSRLSVFLAPEEDSRGAGYQQIQAKITVGSGGLTGKGYTRGTQGQYKFLPVVHNDFIFSVLAEELGFVGVVVVLGLYLFVIIRALVAAEIAREKIGTYLVIGIVSGFFFQIVYNVAMSAGLAPVKGFTLPLMSYGGSSVIATLAGFGLILNVRMRRFSS